MKRIITYNPESNAFENRPDCYPQQQIMLVVATYDKEQISEIDLVDTILPAMELRKTIITAYIIGGIVGGIVAASLSLAIKYLL